MMMTTSIIYFNGFLAKKDEDNYRCLFGWFCCKEGDINNVIAFFYGDGVVKKAVATYGFFFSFFFFFGPFGLFHYKFFLIKRLLVMFVPKHKVSGIS